MKKIILVFMALFVVCSVYSQDEFYYDEETRDAVYVAPDSKFVKKWNRVKDSEVMTFYANKTFKKTISYIDKDYGIEFTFYVHGTWKRDRKMNLSITYTNVTANMNPKAIEKFSARKQDEIRTLMKTTCALMKKEYAGKTTFFLIERVDNDHLVLKEDGWVEKDYFYCSDNLKKKLLEEETKKE